MIIVEEGLSKFPWWKDWRGECVAIVGAGPSANVEQTSKLRNRIHVAAIKQSIELCKDEKGYWPDLVYGCDAHWWEYRKGLREFNGLKIAFDSPKFINIFPDLRKIKVEKEGVKYTQRFMMKTAGHVGGGGNSGFQLLNLVVQFGVRGILLIGFDAKDEHVKPHWYGRNTWPRSTNPNRTAFKGWREAFEQALPTLKSLDVDVINASPITGINCFQKATVDEALEKWGL